MIILYTKDVIKMAKITEDNLYFKSKESAYLHQLENDKIAIIRLDGKSFHTFTRRFKKPFDKEFMGAMDSTAKFVLENVFPFALFGYVQSDEISIVFTDRFNKNREFPFSGRVEKFLTISSSAASLGFERALKTDGLPLFDARVFTVDSFEEVQSYMDWRRMDARKNAITMAATEVHGHRIIEKIPTRKRLEMLEGTEFEILPEGFLYGRLLVKEQRPEITTFVDGRTKEKRTQEIMKSFWNVLPAMRDTTESLVKSFG